MTDKDVKKKAQKIAEELAETRALFDEIEQIKRTAKDGGDNVVALIARPKKDLGEKKGILERYLVMAKTAAKGESNPVLAKGFRASIVDLKAWIEEINSII